MFFLQSKGYNPSKLTHILYLLLFTFSWQHNNKNIPHSSFGHMQILNGLLLDHLEEILICQDVPFPQGDRLYREAFHQYALFPANHMESKKSGLSDS